MRKLLVIRFGALGDLIHVSPSLQAVKAACPDIETHLLTSPPYRDLAPLLPGIDHVWTWQKKDGWHALWHLSQTLRKTGIDSIANLHPSLKTWLFTQWVGPRHSAIYHKEKLSVKGKAQRAIQRRHATEDFYQPFRKLLPLPETLPYVPALKRIDTRTTQTAPNKPDGERWIGLIPGVGTKRSNRAWLPASYVTLILTHLRQPTHRILLFGGPDEQRLSEWLVQEVQNAIQSENTGSNTTETSQEEDASFSKVDLSRLENHCGQHDIPGSAQWMAQCDVILGGDTGPLHLAAGTGVPVIGIFGPTALKRTGPSGLGAIDGLSPPETLECWPCEYAECPFDGDAHLACMREISVPSVEQALNAMLR